LIPLRSQPQLRQQRSRRRPQPPRLFRPRRRLQPAPVAARERPRNCDPVDSSCRWIVSRCGI